MLLHILLLLPATTEGAYEPRDVIVLDGQFVTRNGTTEYLLGQNVVVKGPPWLPSVTGTAACDPKQVCKTFNEQDALYFQSQGWNLVRLAVIWAGGQPTPKPELDADFASRLHAILDLCHRHSIRVILDVHQDAMGTALCGEGVPMWYSQAHLSWLIGKPLVGVKSKPFGKCSVTDLSSWRKHAGDPLYNVLNDCCTAINKPKNDPPGGWGGNTLPTVGVQTTFTHLVTTADGRSAYSRYIGLLAANVSQHPAAIGIELMNEPPFFGSVEPLANSLYELFRDCYDAIRAVSAELAVGVADWGQVASYSDDSHLSSDIRSWLRNNATHLMYTWHYYGNPKPFSKALANAQSISALWKAVPVLTEIQNFENLKVAKNGAFYEYQNYCSVPPSMSNEPSSNCTPGEACAFGACIT